MIHICMALNDASGTYSKYVGTALASIFENTTAEVTAHILCDMTLTADNREKFIQLAALYGHNIDFVLVDEGLFADYALMARNYTIATLYRLALADIFPALDRILYLDADIICNLDIDSLWQTDVSGYALAACHEYMAELPLDKLPLPCAENVVSVDDYVNAGVMLFNLTCIRSRHELLSECCSYLSRNRNSKLPDQDALNVIFRDELLRLPQCYNRATRSFKDKMNVESCIVHFSSDVPSLVDMAWWDELFIRYLLYTPWGKGDDFRHYMMAQLDLEHERRINVERLFRAINKGAKLVIWGANSVLYRRLSDSCLGDITIKYFVDSNYKQAEMSVDIKDAIFPPEHLLTEKVSDIAILVMSINAYDEIKEQLEGYGFVEQLHFFDFRYFLESRHGGIRRYL